MSARWVNLLRRHALATLVLCAALGGGSVYAAGRLGSRDIARNAVHSRQLAPRALAAKQGVIRTGRVNISDPHPNTTDFTTKRLLSYGPFTIRGSCLDTGAAYQTKATIASRDEATGTGIYIASGPPVFHKAAVPLQPPTTGGQANGVNPRAVTAFTHSGKFLSVQVFAAIKAAGSKHDGKPDCSFWVQGLGRR